MMSWDAATTRRSSRVARATVRSEAAMQVLVNSDNHIVGSESVVERVETIVDGALQRFEDRITRVEVHLNDVNSDKTGKNDKRCMMEARIGGLKPIAVTAQADTLVDAIDAAVEKLERAIEHTLGRMAETDGMGPRDSEIASVQKIEDSIRKS
jgi:ribosome-associated translation inhibitor RaiA